MSRWTFGGGTALMLQVGHRHSRDIDIFLADPQDLSYLNPSVADLAVEIEPFDFSGDGARFAKFSFPEVGEIDFIVAPGLTAQPARPTVVEGREVQLETIAEIVVKKVFFRGEHIAPRDIFDIAAVSRGFAREVAAELARFPAQTAAALDRLEKLNPEFVQGAIAQLMIRDEFKDLRHSSLGAAKRLLRRARSPGVKGRR
jgi:predicted nucleotidyltransferase component of viral defense system